MAGEDYILAIDQGTTSTRAVLFDTAGMVCATAQKELTQHYPGNGWVEHDPEEIWSAVLEVCRTALSHLPPSRKQAVVGIGITNQRETTLLWERSSGRTLGRAIVWQDRRTAAVCADLVRQGMEPLVQQKTGLIVDPYFSATKIAWILDHTDGARERAERGDLAFGTVDSFLLWRLTGGAVHATDATNASRTGLFNIETQRWDAELLDLFRVPAPLLPDVRDCVADYGATLPELFGRAIPIGGVAGDQQAAVVGHACFQPGMIKSTYGTGCFVIQNTGDAIVRSSNRLLSTVAYRLNGAVTYGLEGAIFSAGVAVQWLRDGLGIIRSASETEAMAESVSGNNGVYLIPAFTGLGAPYWDPEVRGAIMGLTRDTKAADLVRAALESVCYQTYDLFDAMAADGIIATELRIDGGMAENRWLAQFLADILAIPVERPVVNETTALGAACLAGLRFGVYRDLEDVARCRQSAERFVPVYDEGRRQHFLSGWRKALAQTRYRPE